MDLMECAKQQLIKTFLPLQVDLPIHLSSGDTVFVSFSGEGYDLQGMTDDHKDDVCSMNTQVLLQCSMCVRSAWL